jgi:pimeloyl-ACP methyl ester carboxylesterase
MELVEQDVPTVLGRIRIRVGGEGPVIVFWPSLLMDGTMWNAQAEHFAATHRVVLVDPPGHGGSEPLTDQPAVLRTPFWPVANLRHTAYAEVPPRVEYELTPLGHTPHDPLEALCLWAEEHLPEVLTARDGFDDQADRG